MELEKKNIHMERRKAEGMEQFALKEDLNLSDQKPDILSFVLQRGEVEIEEIRCGTDMLQLRGNLHFIALYQSAEEAGWLESFEGRIPFQEKIGIRGVCPADSVETDGLVEDLNLSLINSRKISVSALLSLHLWTDELCDVEVPVGISGEERVEYRQIDFPVTQLAIHRNDILRIRRELALASSYPNIAKILWQNVEPRNLEYRAMKQSILITGDVYVFCLYVGESEDHPVRSYETILPFEERVDCSGCKENMIPVLRFRSEQRVLTVMPDEDGEERVISMELTMNLKMNVYEDITLPMITDIYGVTCQVETKEQECFLPRIVSNMSARTKVTEQVKVIGKPVLQLMHSQADILPQKQSISENGLLLQGTFYVETMYVTGEDREAYGCQQTMVPYQYEMEIPDITPEDSCMVTAQPEQLQVTMMDGEEMDIKMVLGFETTVFHRVPVSLIEKVTVQKTEDGNRQDLPGIVIYIVKPGDNLWNIGKKYYISVDDIRKANDLETDELLPGQKLLIVR